MSEARALERLITDGFVRREADRWVPADRWHAAVARAAAALMSRGEELEDLRVPVAWALHESYADDLGDDELVDLIAVMTPLTSIQAHEFSGPR